jgi:hypothetical protein
MNSGMREIRLGYFARLVRCELAWPNDHFWKSSRQNTLATTTPLAFFTTKASGFGLTTVQGSGKRRFSLRYWPL